MVLPEEERQRIREEELVRLQAQEEFRAMHRTPRQKDHWRLLGFSFVFMAGLMGLWQIVKILAA